MQPVTANTTRESLDLPSSAPAIAAVASQQTSPPLAARCRYNEGMCVLLRTAYPVGLAATENSILILDLGIEVWDLEDGLQ